MQTQLLEKIDDFKKDLVRLCKLHKMHLDTEDWKIGFGFTEHNEADIWHMSSDHEE